MSIKDRIRGYQYTTSVVIRYGKFSELMKIAKRENRNYRKQRRHERLVVYPVPGRVLGVGQLCILR